MSVFIIAEAGVNHNGSLELAKKLVDAACYAGADCIKFQTFIAKNTVAKEAKKASYQEQSDNLDESQLEMLQKLELSFDEFKNLKLYCDKKNITFLSTGFDIESLHFLNDLEMPLWKIPSGEITNYPYLVQIANFNKPIILSTGMATQKEVEDAVNVLKENKVNKLTILHCTTEYPTPMNEVNLLAMRDLKNNFNLEVGYSDHTMGIEVPTAAVALGASVIEKHFTLDRLMEGPDHKASLEPKELRKMVQNIRNIEKALGTGVKEPTLSELSNKEVARKSIVAKTEILEGELFTEDNITVKRPGYGISPMKWKEVIGKVSKKNFKEDELIEI
ncbi:N-acetylneuraminate synthase [Gracilibacillus halophilus YIM-C55.5]|uniref:N-acetylneuraminate synthase n=1 Tax=Gracilibacillus halophilus YIM-C55.5 TaxID=1308866 RepID=N4WCW8_9BACI|nr:N-acetylneuraminate synthase [Gracilibacillus halophilus]ENH98113.1 N-acetylneuraminate synthase [Gracilibacillus halophilus YIM-C55.5]